MEIYIALQTNNPCYKKNKKCTQKGILVHSTGAVNRDLKRYVDAPERLGKNQYNNHWNKSDANKCMHAFIGYDKDKKIIAVQTLPYDVACWGCGAGKKGSYNYDPTAHIQFEICQGSNTDADYYWKAIKCAEEYCAYLCNLYGWTANDIVSHNEASKAGYASNHGDPENWMKYFGDDMNKFRDRVAALLQGGNNDPENNTNKEDNMNYKYIVTGTRLALRKEPSTSGALITRMDTGTIISGGPVENDWVKISYNGQIGYSMIKYLAVYEEPKTDTNTSSEPTDKEKLDTLWAWYKETH